MAFSMAVIKGERSADNCPCIDKNDAIMINENVETIDWKSDHIRSLMMEVSGIDLYAVSEGLGASMTQGKLSLKCLGMEFLVDSSGGIRPEGHLSQWLNILLLHYVRRGGSSPLSDKWVAFDELKGGLVKASSFKRECEDPLRSFIDKDERTFNEAIELLGGERTEPVSSDEAWVIYPLPKVPFMVLYWRPDQEYSSELKVLFDSTADEYLDVESLIFLGEGLVEILDRMV
ncbi:MAG: DUF3786 domain-containing protein, partial [Nitrospirota bacterium]